MGSDQVNGITKIRANASLCVSPDHAGTDETAMCDIQVEIINGEATEEQKIAFKRFMDWYKAQTVKMAARNNPSIQ